MSTSESSSCNVSLKTELVVIKQYQSEYDGHLYWIKVLVRRQTARYLTKISDKG